MSKRAIKIKLRDMIPQGTHIRSGAIDRIQQILNRKNTVFLQKIVDFAELDEPIVITRGLVDTVFTNMELVSIVKEEEQ